MFLRRLFSLVVMMCCWSAHASELTVLAAASLNNAFKDIAQQYQLRYPGSHVALNFGASGALLQQLGKGAPVDVFASADEESMDTAQRNGWVRASERRDFGTNRLVLVVPADSKLIVKSLSALASPAFTRIAIGNPASVPAGRYARHILEQQQLWQATQSKMINTQNVRQALDYVARGEVDAGFVYATDAAIVADKVKLAMEVVSDVAIRYPIAPCANSADPAEAARFVAFVTSPTGQAIMARYGFLPP